MRINPLIVGGIFMASMAAGLRVDPSGWMLGMAAYLLMLTAVPAVSFYEARWYRGHSRPKMTWLAMVVINVSEVVAFAAGLTFGYALGAS